MALYGHIIHYDHKYRLWVIVFVAYLLGIVYM
jgi:hypothetical protein